MKRDKFRKRGDAHAFSGGNISWQTIWRRRGNRVVNPGKASKAASPDKASRAVSPANTSQRRVARDNPTKRTTRTAIVSGVLRSLVFSAFDSLILRGPSPAAGTSFCWREILSQKLERKFLGGSQCQPGRSLKSRSHY